VIDFEVQGVKELEQRLEKLEERVERKIATQANRAGAAYFRKQLKAQLPRSTRNANRLENKKQAKRLHKSIGIRKQKGRRILHHVGVVGWARAYAHILEFGSKYQSPNPVWRKTLERESPQMLKVIAERIRKGLEQYG
jgi:HK97 gp10 family phage protein